MHGRAGGHSLWGGTVVPPPVWLGVREGTGTFGEDLVVQEAAPGEVLREHSAGNCPDRKLVSSRSICVREGRQEKLIREVITGALKRGESLKENLLY